MTRISEAVDWTQQPTTRDQVCIEAVLDTMAVTDASILHVGVGNSSSPNALPAGLAASMA